MNTAHLFFAIADNMGGGSGWIFKLFKKFSYPFPSRFIHIHSTNAIVKRCHETFFAPFRCFWVEKISIFFCFTFYLKEIVNFESLFCFNYHRKTFLYWNKITIFQPSWKCLNFLANKKFTLDHRDSNFSTFFAVLRFSSFNYFPFFSVK